VVKNYVLDANALVRLFRDTPGADVVDDLIKQTKSGRAHLGMSVVNLTEVLYILARYCGPDRALLCIGKARQVVELMPADEQIAIDAGLLRLRYKIGLADCFAAELAMRDGATLVTADPDFAKLGKQLKILALPRHAQ
jgi:predicted nucleic acid-binding protein